MEKLTDFISSRCDTTEANTCTDLSRLYDAYIGSLPDAKGLLSKKEFLNALACRFKVKKFIGHFWFYGVTLKNLSSFDFNNCPGCGGSFSEKRKEAYSNRPQAKFCTMCGYKLRS